MKRHFNVMKHITHFTFFNNLSFQLNLSVKNFVIYEKWL
jgi:hypothetical protein